jgi:diguanylate cyclase (GGDEF)-like protein
MNQNIKSFVTPSNEAAIVASIGNGVSIDILKALVIPAFVIDSMGRVILWNDACAQLTGVSANSVLGTTEHWQGFYKTSRFCLADFVVHGKIDEVTNFFVEADSTGKHLGNLTAKGWYVLPHTGAKSYLVIDASAIRDENGELIAVVQTLRDMTALRRAEIALEMSQETGAEKRRRSDFSGIEPSGAMTANSPSLKEILWRQANYDALTSLPNRKLFHSLLETQVHAAHKSGQQLALLVIDLDNFKDVNVALGHSAGDRLLAEAAQRLLLVIRDLDVVAHLGGDEFAVILSDVETGAVEHIANRVLSTIAESFKIDDEEAYITATLGIALYPNDAVQAQDLLKNANHAMHDAKSEGNNRFGYYLGKTVAGFENKMRLLADLHTALALNQLEVHYQPIISLKTGQIVKAEALIRWKHPDLGWVSPIEFIPMAEKSGLIHSIGDWVFRESAKWSNHWSKQLGRVFQVSVNKSPVQFVQQEYPFSWTDHLKKHGMPGQSIGVEITEGILLNAASQVNDQLRDCRDEGMEVAIDDFGTGYSSLSYLKKFHVDYLKIDQSFVRDMSEDENDRAIAETIIVMAHKLGLRVIAEGIETPAQRDLLTAAGCDFGQGWLFSKALPPEQMEVLLRQDKRFLKLPELL